MARAYVWFGPETVEELRGRLNAAGPARLELRSQGIGKKKKYTLRVVPVGAVAALDEGGDLNKSHICPPFCP